MKTIKSFLIIIGLILASCEGLVEGINENPNNITIGDVEAQAFLTGAMLANNVAQGGHLNRIAGMYSGHLIGFTSLYSNIYGYNLSTVESNGAWNRWYIGVVPNTRHIIRTVPEDKLLTGISKVLEAHALGTAATLFGDIPYSEINNPDVGNPSFDSQSAIFDSLIIKLDDAIADLTVATSRNLPEDIVFEGDASKWMETASTLKARYFLQMKDYGNALSAAVSGISSSANNMQYIPRGDPAVDDGDKNLFYEILAGSRQGDIGTGNSYLMQLVDAGSGISRNNAKTDEAARFGYYTIDENSASGNMGIIHQFEPQNFVSYAENQLIMAEAEARANGVSVNALAHLNAWRAAMAAGEHVNANFQAAPRQYDAYVAADFTPTTGMENADGIAADRAFLREVIEERYVSGMQNYMAFNDLRRLTSETDLLVPFPLNPGGTQQPQRLLYADDELSSNSSAPADPGLFAKTEVNQ